MRNLELNYNIITNNYCLYCNRFVPTCKWLKMDINKNYTVQILLYTIKKIIFHLSMKTCTDTSSPQIVVFVTQVDLGTYKLTGAV